jgi:serine-protein kinase ATM
LFQCLRDERAKVLKSTAKNSDSTRNLAKCANALRLVIASGVRTIKSSTVEIIIDTIVEVLPNRDPPRLKPLLEDVPKTLRLLLDYQPHVECLSLGCWKAAVDFCIDSLAGSSIEAEEQAPNSWSTNVSSRGRTPFESTDASMARGSPREPVARTKSVTDGFSHSTEDFIHCLLALVKATNAPVLGKAEAIMTALLYFLKRRSGRGSVAAAALAGINAILARTALQMLDLSKRITKELLPLMKVMWSEQILRDEILITLTYTEAHITSLVADMDDTSTCADIEAVLETMYADYRTRKETTMHQYLEEDHLCFRHLGAVDADTHPLNTLAFSMETEHVKPEGLWATVHTIARFSSMLDKRKRKIAHDREVDGESLSKRARIDLLFDEYTRHISEPRSNAKRAALQVVAFSIQEGPVDEDKLQTLMDKLTSCMSEENATHSIWAMVALAA